MGSFEASFQIGLALKGVGVMGSLFKGVCYPDFQEVKNQSCSQYSGQTIRDDGIVFSYWCAAEYVEKDSMYVYKAKNGEAFEMSPYPWPVVTDCDYSGTTDLAYEWFLLAMGLLVVVWGGKLLIRLFESHHDRD